MNVTGVILNVTNRLKPILLRVFPYELLRQAKGKMISKSFKSIQRIRVLPFVRTEYLDGINLVGNIRAETGLGQSCRLVAQELEASGLAYSIFQYDQLGIMTEGKYDAFNLKMSKNLPYNINLIHINPHELGLAFQRDYVKIWNSRYNIGFWLWELADFPDEWTPCFDCMDEIWTPSEFISNSIRKKTELPVMTIPYAINVQPPESEKLAYRKQFDLPADRFLFLMMYDQTSISVRKNPEAVIQAYNLLLSKLNHNQKTGLVIKVNNASQTELQRLEKMVSGIENVYFITEILTRESVNELIYCVDVTVSLHRAEGFGLVLAESMALGTPTIATNWSSNIEFMNRNVACMVDAKMVKLEMDIGNFKKGNQWAEPDIEQAAEYMKRLTEDEQYRISIACNAKQYVNDILSLERAADSIRKRIVSIYEEQKNE